MRIQIFVDGQESLLKDIRSLVDDAIVQAGVADAEIEVITVRSDDEAKAVRSLGAPTVRVDGFDVEYAEREPPETTSGARYYSTPDGWRRMPDVGVIVFAIREAQIRSSRRQATS